MADLPPLQHPYPLRGCNSDLAQYSNTPARNASRSDAGGPSLRAARFEDEDDDENEAPGEGRSPIPTLATHSTRPYTSSELASVYFSLLRKCGLVIANGIGSVICLGTASVLAGFMYGEVSTPRVFMLLFLILLFLAAGFYLFIRCLKVISPRRRTGGYPWHVHHHEPK